MSNQGSLIEVSPCWYFFECFRSRVDLAYYGSIEVTTGRGNEGVHHFIARDEGLDDGDNVLLQILTDLDYMVLNHLSLLAREIISLSKGSHVCFDPR